MYIVVFLTKISHSDSQLDTQINFVEAPSDLLDFSQKLEYCKKLSIVLLSPLSENKTNILNIHFTNSNIYIKPVLLAVLVTMPHTLQHLSGC